MLVYYTLNVCWYALSKEEPYCNQTNPNPNEIQMICFFKTCCKGNDCKRYLEPKARKASCSNHIPTKISKDFKELFATFVYNNYKSPINKELYKKSLLDGTFSQDLKTAEIVPVYK